MSCRKGDDSLLLLPLEIIAGLMIGGFYVAKLTTVLSYKGIKAVADAGSRYQKGREIEGSLAAVDQHIRMAASGLESEVAQGLEGYSADLARKVEDGFAYVGQSLSEVARQAEDGKSTIEDQIEGVRAATDAFREGYARDVAQMTSDISATIGRSMELGSKSISSAQRMGRRSLAQIDEIERREDYASGAAALMLDNLLAAYDGLRDDELAGLIEACGLADDYESLGRQLESASRFLSTMPSVTYATGFKALLNARSLTSRLEVLKEELYTKYDVALEAASTLLESVNTVVRRVRLPLTDGTSREADIGIDTYSRGKLAEIRDRVLNEHGWLSQGLPYLSDLDASLSELQAIDAQYRQVMVEAVSNYALAQQAKGEFLAAANRIRSLGYMPSIDEGLRAFLKEGYDDDPFSYQDLRFTAAFTANPALMVEVIVVPDYEKRTVHKEVRSLTDLPVSPTIVRELNQTLGIDLKELPDEGRYIPGQPGRTPSNMVYRRSGRTGI